MLVRSVSSSSLFLYRIQDAKLQSPEAAWLIALLAIRSRAGGGTLLAVEIEAGCSKLISLSKTATQVLRKGCLAENSARRATGQVDSRLCRGSRIFAIGVEYRSGR